MLLISDKFQGYADEVFAALKAAGIRASVNDSADKVGAKIREATMQKIPYLLVVGGREAETKTVAVRTREGQDVGVLPLTDLVARLKEQISQKK